MEVPNGPNLKCTISIALGNIAMAVWLVLITAIAIK